MPPSGKKGRWKSAAARRVKQAAGVADIDRALDKVVLNLLDGIACPPTDLDALMARLNVCRVETNADMMITGALKKEGEQFVIQVFPGLSSGRRRFTIAHELGHAFMETTGPHAPRTGAELETICDRFAAEVLMPRRAFAACVGSSPDIAAVLEAATTFRASRAAAFGRVRDLYGMKCGEFEEGRFHWTFGVGNLERSILSRSLQETDGREGVKEVDLYSARGYSTWRMEWQRMGDGGRTVCLLAPEVGRRR